MRAADVVAFLDFDQELLAPRYRAGEQALALLARAARLVGGRAGGGRLLVQTRLPHHEVLDAVLHADPGRLAATEAPAARRSASRRTRRWRPCRGRPPTRSSAPSAGRSASRSWARPTPAGSCGRPDHRTLCDALAAATPPAGRLRVEVDPLRI